MRKGHETIPVKNVKEKVLTAQERRFFGLYASGMSATDAYLKTFGSKKMSRNVAGVGAHRMLTNIRDRSDFKELLDAADLGDDRLLRELNKGLSATKVETYRGEIMKDEKGEIIKFDDNHVQQRSRELLADVIGRRKASVDVTVGGASGIILLPAKLDAVAWTAETEALHRAEEAKKAKKKSSPSET